MLGHPLSIIRPAIAVVGLILVLSSFTTGWHLYAQTTSGTLMGAVRDKQGKALSETKVTIENEENGNLRATRTDDGGNYTFFNLPPGSYKVTASRTGFRDQTIQGFPVQFNQRNVVRLPLFTLLTATLKGRVFDTASNVLPGARVIVVGVADKITHETVSSSDGRYTLSDLPFGD